MNQQTAISVIIVSQGRPDDLRRCLLALSQQYYDNFEVIVVADDAGCAVANEFAETKIISFAKANISAARNLGIKAAAGDLIAFIDDNSAAEPTWLTRLVLAFDDQKTAAATGFVRGRNGISFQWQGRLVDAKGQTIPVEVAPNSPPCVINQKNGWALKIEGTNMMFRAKTLRGIGGFDERLHFYLDETDLGFRLAMAGHKMALCPMAQVHHGFAASTRRAASRAPLSLFEIGASLSIYLKKHAGDQYHLKTERQVQRNRLLRYMVRGELLPTQIAPLLNSFDMGIAAAESRAPVVPDLDGKNTFTPFAKQVTPSPTTFLKGRPWQRQNLMKQARELLANGQRVHVLILSPTALYHRIDFDHDGIWVQSGGLFGRAQRKQPLFRLVSFQARAELENCDRKTVQHP